MIIDPANQSRLVTDSKCGDDNAPEQPVLIEKYNDGISINAWDGQTIHIPFSMIPDVIKVFKMFNK